jgi:hypothetical protein
MNEKDLTTPLLSSIKKSNENDDENRYKDIYQPQTLKGEISDISFGKSYIPPVTRGLDERMKKDTEPEPEPEQELEYINIRLPDNFYHLTIFNGLKKEEKKLYLQKILEMNNMTNQTLNDKKPKELNELYRYFYTMYKRDEKNKNEKNKK